MSAPTRIAAIAALRELTDLPLDGGNWSADLHLAVLALIDEIPVAAAVGAIAPEAARVLRAMASLSEDGELHMYELSPDAPGDYELDNAIADWVRAICPITVSL
jgi:hypothetical protein